MFFSSSLRPVSGGVMISVRWPLPTGAKKSSSRMSAPQPGCSSFSRSLGSSGVSSLNGIRLLSSSTELPFTASTCSSAKYFSPSFGGRTGPANMWPSLRLSRRIWLGLT